MFPAAPMALNTHSGVVFIKQVHCENTWVGLTNHGYFSCNSRQLYCTVEIYKNVSIASQAVTFK